MGHLARLQPQSPVDTGLEAAALCNGSLHPSRGLDESSFIQERALDAMPPHYLAAQDVQEASDVANAIPTQILRQTKRNENSSDQRADEIVEPRNEHPSWRNQPVRLIQVISPNEFVSTSFIYASYCSSRRGSEPPQRPPL